MKFRGMLTGGSIQSLHMEVHETGEMTIGPVVDNVLWRLDWRFMKVGEITPIDILKRQ